MSRPNFTGGHWCVIPPMNYCVGPTIQSAGTITACGISRHISQVIATIHRHHDETIPNATLLAAAPALYEACREVLDALKCYAGQSAEAREAEGWDFAGSMEILQAAIALAEQPMWTASPQGAWVGVPVEVLSQLERESR